MFHINATPLPSQHELMALFDYDVDTGSLIRRRSGKFAGGPNANGYIQLLVNGKNRYGHRVVWTMFHGDIPTGMTIDHIDGDPGNNRIENLRLVPQAINAKNCKRSINNTSGVTGVSWYAKLGKWVAKGTLDRKSYHLGCFSAKSEAAEAVASFYRANGFTERHINA